MPQSFLHGSTLDAFIGFAADPFNIPLIYPLSNAARSRPGHQRMMDKYLDIPEVRALWEQNYPCNTIPDIKALAAMDKSTLGGAYADLLVANNFTPDFYTSVAKIANANDYVEERLRHTHDVWHTVTGFSTEYPGEMAIVAFMAAQLSLPIASLLIGTSMIYLVDHPEDTQAIFTAISAGWHAGLRSEHLLSMRWEEMWHLPLGEVRKSLNIPPEGFDHKDYPTLPVSRTRQPSTPHSLTIKHSKSSELDIVL